MGGTTDTEEGVGDGGGARDAGEGSLRCEGAEPEAAEDLLREPFGPGCSSPSSPVEKRTAEQYPSEDVISKVNPSGDL